MASLFFALACNGPFLAAALAGRSWAVASTWGFAAALAVLLTAVHLLLLCMVLTRWNAQPLLSVLIVATAFATYFMQKYGVFLDPGMLRNVLRTDAPEAGELFGWALLPHMLLYAVVPIAALWRVRLVERSVARRLLVRTATMGAAGGVALAALLLVFQDFSALMRNHTEVRYLITPANYLYSTARVLAADSRQARSARTPVGGDARLGAAWQQRSKPALFIIVVGETARAANWGLNGYARQTTPQLAALDVLNFRDVTACGTNTEVSLPCMFSAVGRRDYDETRIRSSESLLHVLKRAGFSVLWRDNQSGCKGVCDGVAQDRPDRQPTASLCAEGRCLDEMLLHGLDTVARDARGSVVIVLHTLGNHGPAYHRRYPPAFRRFSPTCDTGELRECEPEAIVNAYDNALLYTDQVLANTIAFLKRQEAGYDTAMLYVSDHGESLGEKGLYLHGVPYAIAPSEQTRVPMVWWLSPGFWQSARLDRRCLAAQTSKSWSHDHLFHTVLGLLAVDARVYDRGLDIGAACRG